MDQAPESTDQRRTDQNNNSRGACSCSNISIMQLFHEMKQEFPKVPDDIVQQNVTDNCHNRSACIDQLRKANTATTPTTKMYPSKSIHSNQQTPRSPVMNGAKWANNQKMKQISEKFENSSSDTSASSDKKIKRPSTLALRRAPDPPTSSNASTPNSATNLSKFTSPTSSTSSLVASTSSISSNNNQSDISPQFHHNVTLDSSASKFNDSLNVQLNVTVSPISSSAPPIPPRPTRHLSQLNVRPEPAYRMLDTKTAQSGGTSVATAGQKSYTSVNFTLRQPTSILPSPITPIDIQAGPSSLTYSSSSFDAKQGFQSNLKITVAGNGESCIQTVRTRQPVGNTFTDLSQIDTTISIGDELETSEPIRIITNPHKQPITPINRMTRGDYAKMSMSAEAEYCYFFFQTNFIS